MKKIRTFTLCTILAMTALFAVACGNNADNNSRQAPYEDEINNGGVNEGQNGSAGSDLRDAGENLMDSIRDTGDAIRNGVDDITDMPNNDMDVNPDDAGMNRNSEYGNTYDDTTNNNNASGAQNGTYNNGMTNP